MHLIPSEFAVAEVYFPPLLIAAVIGVVAAWLTALVLNRYRLSRFFFYPPVVPLALAVIDANSFWVHGFSSLGVGCISCEMPVC